jgi:hypothetical protein
MYSDTCTCADCKLIRKLRGERNTMNDLQRLVPEGTTHFTIEERQHRGSTVYAVVAIVPNGAAVPLNGYSTRELAESTAQNLSANPTTHPRRRMPDLSAIAWMETSEDKDDSL